MKFTLTVTLPDGSGQREEHTAESMRESLQSIARVLEAIVPGESLTIKRIA